HRMQDGDFARRHQLDPPRPGRGGDGVGNEPSAGPAPRCRTAGAPPHPPGVGEHLGIAVQGHVAGVGDRGYRTRVRRDADSRAELPRARNADCDGRDLLAAGLPPGKARRLDPAPLRRDRMNADTSSPQRPKSSGAKIIRYRGVIKRYGGFQALWGGDLHVHRGEVVCLIGPSGSGKSTLLRCTNGLEALDGGDIEFEDALLPKDEKTLRAMRARMGMVFQSFELFPHLTAQQSVAEGPRTVQKMSLAEANRRAAAMLAKVGLA